MLRSRALPLLPLVALLACGYQPLPGAAPFEQASVKVLPFVEREPVGVAPLLTAALAHELAQSGMPLARTEADSTAVLRGLLESESVASSPSQSSQGGIAAYRVRVVASAELRAKSGALLWRGEASAEDDFVPPAATAMADPELGTETRRRVAHQRIAETLAADLREQLALAALIAAERP